jgi:hypothetical protein
VTPLSLVEFKEVLIRGYTNDSNNPGCLSKKNTIKVASSNIKNKGQGSQWRWGRDAQETLNLKIAQGSIRQQLYNDLSAVSEQI